MTLRAKLILVSLISSALVLGSAAPAAALFVWGWGHKPSQPKLPQPPFGVVAARATRLAGGGMVFPAGWDARVVAVKQEGGRTLYEVNFLIGGGWVPAKNVWRVLSTRHFEGVAKSRVSLWSIHWKRLKRIPRGDKVLVLRKVQGHPKQLYQVQHEGTKGWLAVNTIQRIKWLSPKKRPQTKPPETSEAEREAKRRAAEEARRRAAETERLREAQRNIQKIRDMNLMEETGTWGAIKSMGRRAARRLGSAVSRTNRWARRTVSRAASRAWNWGWRTTSNVARRVARTATRVARGVARVTRRAGRWGRRAAGRAYRWGKHQGRRVGRAARRVGRYVKKRAVAAYRWAKDKFNIIARYGRKVLAKVKRLAKKYLLPLAKKFLKKVRALLPKALKAARRAKAAIAKIRQVIDGARGIIDSIRDPQQYAEAAKERLIELLTEAAMRVLRPTLVKINGFMVGWALKTIKHPVSHAIATALTSVITSAIASVTAGAGALVGPVLKPLNKWAVDKIMDWAIDKIKGWIGELLFERSKSFLGEKLIRPAVQRAYDALVAYLKRKFPGAWKKAKGLLDKARNVADKAEKVLDKAESAIDKVSSAADVANWVAKHHQLISRYGRQALRVVTRAARTHVSRLARALYREVLRLLPRALRGVSAQPVVQAIRAAIRGIKAIIDAIPNPSLYFRSSKKRRVWYFSSVSLRVLAKKVARVVGFLAGWALTFLKARVMKSIDRAIGRTIDSAVDSVARRATGALAHAAGPLKKWVTAEARAWLKGRIQARLAGMIRRPANTIIRKKLIMPLVERSYDRLVSALRRRYPRPR